MSDRDKDTSKFSESEKAERDENIDCDGLGDISASQSVPRQPIMAQPVIAQPVMAQPVAAQPITAQPVAAKPIHAQPVMAQSATAPPEPEASLSSSGFVLEEEQTKFAKCLDWLVLNKVKCLGVIAGLLLITTYIFFVHPRIFGNSTTPRDASVAGPTKTRESGTPMDGHSSLAAFCPEKVLESGNKVAGVFTGIDCGDYCYANITLDSGEDVYLLCDEEKWGKHFGTPGNRVSVDYDLIQFLDEGGQYCNRSEFVTGVRVLAAGAASDKGKQQEVMAANKVAANEAPVREAGTFTNSLGIEFVLIPAGSFSGSWSGKNDFGENVIHQQVRIISKPFYLGKYEVTQEQWVAVMGEGSNPSSTKVRNHPVTDVPWNDVQVFIQRLNQNESRGQYRLPTEAEWEYAARAGTDTEWFFGDDPADLGEYAWYADNSGEKDNFGKVVMYPKTRPIGQKKPNPWGLHDIYGNAEEWVQDWYDVETNKPGSRRGWYKPGEVIDPAGPNEPPPYGLHVVRGRHYSAILESHESGWSSLRRGGSYNGDEKTGFRLVFSPGAPQQASANDALVVAGATPDNLDRVSRQEAIDQTVSMLQQIAIAEVALNMDSSNYVYTAGGDTGPSGRPQDSIRAIEALAQYGFRPDPYVAFTILPLNRGDMAGVLVIAGHKKIGSPIFVYDVTDSKRGVVAYDEYKRGNPNLKLDHFTLKTYVYENGRVRVDEERNISP